MEPTQISVLYDNQIEKILPRGLAVGAGIHIDEQTSEVDNELNKVFRSNNHVYLIKLGNNLINKHYNITIINMRNRVTTHQEIWAVQLPPGLKSSSIMAGIQTIEFCLGKMNPIKFFSCTHKCPKLISEWAEIHILHSGWRILHHVYFSESGINFQFDIKKYPRKIV